VIPAVLVVMALVTAVFVLGPLARPEAASAPETDVDRLLRARETAYRALRELETDREAGKIADSDYAALRVRVETEAVAVLHRLDALAAASGPRPDPGPASASGREGPS